MVSAKDGLRASLLLTSSQQSPERSIQYLASRSIEMI